MADLPSITDFYSQAQKIGFGKKYNFKVTSIDYIPNDPGVGYDKNYLLYVESLNGWSTFRSKNYHSSD